MKTHNATRFSYVCDRPNKGQISIAFQPDNRFATIFYWIALLDDIQDMLRYGNIAEWIAREKPRYDYNKDRNNRLYFVDLMIAEQMQPERFVKQPMMFLVGHNENVFLTAQNVEERIEMSREFGLDFVLTMDSIFDPEWN